MGCNGLTLNEKLALDLILAIRESHYKWPEDFVKSSQSNGSAELSDMLKTAYLDNYYYGGFNDSLNWVLWVKGLKRACNTSVGDGIYPMTWSYSLQKWQEAMVSEFENRTTDDQLTYAKNWTSLWFDPLRDTCKRDVWIHFTEKRPQKNVGEFELIWHSGKTIELCTTNLELGWLMRFVPMYRRYVWTLILLGSKEGWYGPPQYKMIGAYWKYGARRYDYVLRSCYNIWSWGCNGTAVNETWAREWVKYSTMNGFSWDEDFVHSDMDVDGFVQTYGLDWDGLSVLNGTESEKLNWALWHDAYAKVCNATFGERSEEKLVDVIQEWKANKVAEFTRSSNITINGNWSDLWRYPFRHSCITKLKIYRRFAYDLIVRKGRHSMMGYWMQKYMKGDWNTAYFQNVKTWKVKEFSWDSFMDLSFFDSYGSCIDTWRPGCNTTLTNSSYLDMWRDLMDRAGFEWSGNFTLHTNNSFVEELADKFLPDRNMSDVADFNWAFWFDGWQAMCNASVEEEDGNMNWTHVVYRWASDWTERLDNERSSAVDWMKLWIEPLLYMCNYTGANDTISEDFTNLLTMSTGDGVHLTSSAIVAREIRFERVIERRMEEVRKQRRHYQYSFNYGLCISVWTSVCEGNKDLNMTEVNGLLQCLQRSTPALNFMNYTSDEVEQLLSTTSLMGLTDGETQLLNGLKNHTIPNISELVWKLWVGGWKSVCSKTDANGITLDEVLAALEETFEDNQLLQIGGTVDEWKKAWIQPWVGPCKGEAFSCEYQEEYEELGPMTWNYECSVYLNDTIQSFNWTSAGDDWKERCHFAYGSRFDWTDIDEVMKVWTDLCNAGANGGGNGGLLPYTEDKWDEDFDIACHKLKIFKIDDDGDGI
ncbi:hypothetical protein LSH36_713g01012 [Paralvinella palmiformis]|uniref:Uncharacterized protein n=1 Tax=Paralvinella palmiformis TaxID=53620 RepID=A0AAD9J2V6_9ANNE|nr:hypothetical protein LSH36_713g01012 [Paralvinella palmiformis]